MVNKIALEEHFLCPDFIEYWNPTVVDLPAERRDKALTRLTDFGELRLAAMDKAGIARAVIGDRKSTRLNSSHRSLSRMPSSA